MPDMDTSATKSLARHAERLVKEVRHRRSPWLGLGARLVVPLEAAKDPQDRLIARDLLATHYSAVGL